jgi:PAS domain S-box-containing protein
MRHRSPEQRTFEVSIGSTRQRPSRFSISNLPIKHRLPLLIGTLLFGIFAVSGFASYRAIREASFEIGRERLQSITQFLTTALQQQGNTMTSRIATTANNSAIRGFLKSPSTTTQAAAIAILQPLANPQDQSHLQIELWNIDNKLVLTIPNGMPARPADLSAEIHQASANPFKAVGKIRVLNETLAFPVVAAVKDDPGNPIGYLVRWRRLAGSPETRKQLTDMVGNQAVLYLGNVDGDVWTDMVKVVSKPPVPLGSTLETTHYARDGNSVMALGRPLTDTPWFIVVEFPNQVLLSQANRFMRRLAIIGVALLALGIAAAFVLSQNITRPLNLLTAAALGISSGDYSGMVSIRRNDELGALGNAFNSMVVKLRGSQDDLEQKIQELKPLQEAASKLAAIVQWSHDAIIGKTQDGIITSWNRGAESLYHYSAEEIVGRSITTLAPPEHSDEISETLQRVMRGESVEHFETEGISKEGKRILISSTISPIRDESGAISGSSTIARDITERKLAEEELRQTNHRLKAALMELQTKTNELASMTQQLWQASKLATMGELAASVAHELNNPLATISLRLDSLAAQLNGDQKQSQMVEIIADEVERMGKLVGGLLEFSRRGHQQISTLDARKEIENSLELIENHLRSNNIAVVREFEEIVPMIQADRQQLRQVFLNLLTNASDAMPDGGKLIARVRAGTGEGGVGGVQIEFIDAGSGIAPADLAKIWEPFFTTKPEGKGTGLGLAICRRIIEEHHGTISIEGRLGEGTTVSIFLPATNSRKEDQPTEITK